MIAIKQYSLIELPGKCQDCPMWFMDCGDVEVCELIETINNMPLSTTLDSYIFDCIKDGTRSEHCPLIDVEKGEYWEKYNTLLMKYVKLRQRTRDGYFCKHCKELVGLRCELCGNPAIESELEKK